MTHAPSDRFTAQAVEKNLSTQHLGKTILVYDEVESTNDLLKTIMHEPHYNGLVVFAKNQRRGKGREGRTWTAPADSSILCSSLIHLEGQPHDLAGPISLVCAVAVAQALIHTFQIPVRIKWPNDIYCDGKKLAGILIESSKIRPDQVAFILGIGINLTQQPIDFPPELRDTAVSVAQVLGRPLEPDEKIFLARRVIKELDDQLERMLQKNYDQLRHDWLHLAGGPDQPVIVTRQNQTFNARIIDIDYRDNSLLVQNPGGLILHLKQNTCKII
ncbi:MAG: biotin--[acetyl-CoA-carboxylase] ligase [Phycisphaerae bacterium]|jgi:BirA family biotin operon repressor/biotin-[acetyl-CoA-carboxylase] ligase|nr:biotin--[acetyl-CoA-carboxylase] ligase [Phycisphaerae bacterium]